VEFSSLRKKEMRIVISVVLVAAVVVAALYLVTYFYLAPRAARSIGLTDPEKLAAFQDSYTKTIAQLFAGFAVVGTFAWTIFKDGETLKQTAITGANQQFIDASKLSTDKRAEKSAAGNYAFEKLVLAYPEYCTTVSDILRNQIYARGAKMKPPWQGARPPHVESDIMAAVMVLGAIPRCSGPLRLVDAYVAGADFGRTKSFADANFEGAKLYGAYFGWNVLDNAKFNGAGMADRDAYGEDDQAWEDVKTKDYWNDIKYNFIVNFENSSLKFAQFKNTSVAGASFRNATLDGATFENTDISRADFGGASGLETAFFGASDPETAKKLTAACFKGDAEKPIGLADDFLDLHKVARTCQR
jgi:hypothetical protein